MKVAPLMIALSACDGSDKAEKMYDPCHAAGLETVDFDDTDTHESPNHTFGDCRDMKVLGTLTATWDATNTNLEGVLEEAPDCSGITPRLVVGRSDNSDSEIDTDSELYTGNDFLLNASITEGNEINFATDLGSNCSENTSGSTLLDGPYYLTIEQIASGNPEALAYVWPTNPNEYAFKANLEVTLTCPDITFTLEGERVVDWAWSCEPLSVMWTSFEE